MIACYNDVGHLGIERCLDLLKDRFYWPNMNVDLEEHRGIKFKTHHKRQKYIS